MQLTQFSDYSLRLVLYLAAHPDRLVAVQEVSRAYGISQHHLVKVVQTLVEEDVVTAVRGRRGGLRLKARPGDINVGALVRATEPHFNLVECFDALRNTCPIDRACGLKGALKKAEGAFFAVLDGYTLADFAERVPALIRLWKHPPSTGGRGSHDAPKPARQEVAAPGGIAGGRSAPRRAAPRLEQPEASRGRPRQSAARSNVPRR
jgi:Rrf2 family nitric oxide-sensitive transcriptional repressor